MTLIGATTENPSFTVINALLSRCRTYVLEPIKPEEVVDFIMKNLPTISERYPNINLLEKGGAEERGGGLAVSGIQHIPFRSDLEEKAKELRKEMT